MAPFARADPNDEPAPAPSQISASRSIACPGSGFLGCLGLGLGFKVSGISGFRV